MFKNIREEWEVCIKPALKVGALIFTGQLIVGWSGLHFGVIDDSNIDMALFTICVFPWWIVLTLPLVSMGLERWREVKLARKLKRKVTP